ncbi:MAG: hypothetical protein NDJ92_13610 [Thermoanaerobaculia bacterium]|nr:hypothetical protein [Thermoanaerobaculia bacterium]
MARLMLLLLFLPSSIGAAIVERVPVAAPVSSLVEVGAARVVASDAGAFLVNGQRISSDGVALDAEPVRGAEGYATAWSDGWLIIRTYQGQHYVTHLGLTGAPELVQQIPTGDYFQDAASVSGRLAMLEIQHVEAQSYLRITITDGREVIRRATLGRAEGAKIARFDGEFLVVSWELRADNRRTLSAWRLDADGIPLDVRVLGESSAYPEDQVFVAVNGEKALILTRDWNVARCRIIDRTLSSTVLLSIDQSGILYTYWSIPLPTNEGFFVPYTKYEFPEKASRAMVVRLDGTVGGDSVVDPVAEGDRSGNRYLVVRPWGHAAIAEGDPRKIVSTPFTLRRRVYESWTNLETFVSGDVTLVAFGGNRFVRVEANGTAIDPAPQSIPYGYASEIAALPDGFAFAWREGGAVRWQRLSRRGGWIDSEPRTLTPAEGALGIALHANGRDLLLAWTTDSETRWSRFAFDGTPVQNGFDRVPHAPREEYTGEPSAISIGGRSDERIILVEDTFTCNILCFTPPLKLEAFTVDGDGRQLGPLTLVDSYDSSGAAGLADGTWVLQVYAPSSDRHEILHLARNGTPLGQSYVAAISGTLADLAPTETGWKAIVGSPWRFVEVEGATEATRVTGLAGLGSPQFAFGGRLAFLDQGAELESVAVPWTGRLSATDGDLAIHLTDLGIDRRGQHLTVRVHNQAQKDATGVYVASTDGYSIGLSDPYLLGTVRSGEIVQFNIVGSPYAGPFMVLSSDVSDTDPSDNRIDKSAAEPRAPRRRPLRR